MQHQPSNQPPGPSAGDPPEQRRLAVIMFTDMVGYSALTQQDEKLALRLLEEHRQIVRLVLARHSGREIKTIGDAFLVEFSSALAAATCAVEIQKTLHTRNLAADPGQQIQIRIGLHAGDLICRENDVFGDGVNIAARIEPLAEAGGICLSEDVARQVQNKLAQPLVRLGSGELKNIALPVAIYRVVLPWLRPRNLLADRMLFLFRKKSGRRILWAGALGLVAFGAAVWFRSRPPAPEPAPSNRLAVLPLVNLSGDPKDEYFADGMTEELISSLSSIRELSVIARTSIAKFKGARLDIAEIGSALKVGSILEGSVRLAGDQVRINLNLIDVRNQQALWSQEFTRPVKDVFTVQTAIAMNVTEALKVRLFAGEKSLIERRGTENSEAYRQYLLGRSHLNKRTGDEVVRAIEYFSRSIELDARFALAHAGLAESYTLAGGAGYGTLPREQTVELARSSARRAIALDESLAEAHAALGYVRFRIDWDWAAAETEFKRALELKPGYARAHEWYALFLAIHRRFAEATTEIIRAQHLDPLSAGVSTGYGRILHFQRRYDEAVQQFKKTLELDPQYAEAHFSLGMTYHCLGRHEEAVAELKVAVALSGQRPIMVSMLALAEAAAGQKSVAQKIYDDLLASSQTTRVSPYYLGIISLGLGADDRAFSYFEAAYAEREGTMIFLGVDPTTDRIWSDPRYVALVRKMGLR